MHDVSLPELKKASFIKRLVDKILGDSVIGFFQVHLNEHKPDALFLSLRGMEDFLVDYNVVSNLATWNETTLVRGGEVWHQLF